VFAAAAAANDNNNNNNSQSSQRQAGPTDGRTVEASPTGQPHSATRERQDTFGQTGGQIKHWKANVPII